MVIKKSSKSLQNLKPKVKAITKTSKKSFKNGKRHSDNKTDSMNKDSSISKIFNKKQAVKTKDQQEKKDFEGVKNQRKKRSRDDATIEANEEPQSKKQKIVKAVVDKNNSNDNEKLSQTTTPQENKGAKQKVKNLKYLTCKDATVQQDLLLKEQRDKRCLIVKNLNAATTIEELQAASSDIVEVRDQILRSKKAGGRKLAFLEFRDEVSCKRNLESVREYLATHQEEAVVELAEKDKVHSTNLAFDPLRLFVNGFEPGCRKSEIEALFPSSTSVDGVFSKENKLENKHVIVAFPNAKESSRVKGSPMTFGGRDLFIEFARADKRRCRRAAKKAIKNEQRKKLKKTKDAEISEKEQVGLEVAQKSEQSTKNSKLPKNIKKPANGEGKPLPKKEKSKKVSPKQTGNKTRKS